MLFFSVKQNSVECFPNINLSTLSMQNEIHLSLLVVFKWSLNFFPSWAFYVHIHKVLFWDEPTDVEKNQFHCVDTIYLRWNQIFCVQKGDLQNILMNIVFSICFLKWINIVFFWHKAANLVLKSFEWLKTLATLDLSQSSTQLSKSSSPAILQ